jgi:hypothetical protein
MALVLVHSRPRVGLDADLSSLAVFLRSPGVRPAQHGLELKFGGNERQAMDDATAEKIARNNAAFREANDQIENAATDYGVDQGQPVPFLCECSDRRCVEIILLTLGEYRHVRSNPRWFAHDVNHERQLANVVEPVEEHERFLIVEKINHAGEVAARLVGDEGSE